MIDVRCFGLRWTIEGSVICMGGVFVYFDFGHVRHELVFGYSVDLVILQRMS